MANTFNLSCVGGCCVWVGKNGCTGGAVAVKLVEGQDLVKHLGVNLDAAVHVGINVHTGTVQHQSGHVPHPMCMYCAYA